MSADNKHSRGINWPYGGGYLCWCSIPMGAVEGTPWDILMHSNPGWLNQASFSHIYISKVTVVWININVLIWIKHARNALNRHNKYRTLRTLEIK